MKKRYELRYNPDLEGGDATTVLYIGESAFCGKRQTVKFGSVEEADIYLAASGLEKGDAKPVPPFRSRGVEYRNVLAWEVTPCSRSAGNARKGRLGAVLEIASLAQASLSCGASASSGGSSDRRT